MIVQLQKHCIIIDQAKKPEYASSHHHNKKNKKRWQAKDWWERGGIAEPLLLGWLCTCHDWNKWGGWFWYQPQLAWVTILIYTMSLQHVGNHGAPQSS